MPCVPGVSWPALQKEAGETRISPCFPCNFGPHVRHRRAGKKPTSAWWQDGLPRYREAGVLLLRGRILFIHYRHSGPLYTTHRLNIRLPTRERDPTQVPADPLVPAGLPQARDTYHCPPLPQNSNALQRQGNVVVVAAAVVLALSLPLALPSTQSPTARCAKRRISQTQSTAFETRLASRLYWLSRPVAQRALRCLQTIGLHLKHSIPGVLHTRTRNLAPCRNWPYSRWSKSGVARYTPVRLPYPASIGSHTQPPNHQPVGFDAQLSIASAPAHKGSSVNKYHAFLPLIPLSQSVQDFHFSHPPFFLSHPAILAVQVPSLHSGSDHRVPHLSPPAFPYWQRHLTHPSFQL